MHRNPTRPMAPHLTVWKWGPHMLVSILHRITGAGLATVGAFFFTWWLVAAAGGPEAYADFQGVLAWLTGAGRELNQEALDWLVWTIGLALGIGLTWAFFQHMLSGLRHFVMDIGAGYELRANGIWAVLTMAGAVLLTALLWAWLIWGRGA